MRFHIRKRRPPAVNIVSLIDILAILLIFFIVTTTFKRDEPEVVINLPESKTASIRRDETTSVILTITEREEVYLGNEIVSVGELGERVRRLMEDAPGRAVAMQADRGASFGIVIKVLDKLKEAGVKNLPAFTRRPER